VTFNGGIGSAGFTLDVDAVLTFSQGDSGASESETLQAKALAATSGCGYFACISVTELVSRVVIFRPYGQGMCVTLVLANAGIAYTSGVTLPSPWIVESAAKWPYATAACTTTPPPAGAIRAADVTGAAGFTGSLGLSSFALSVSANLSFPAGDSGADQSVYFQASSVAATASCK
jgi:hypothetical protein